MKYRRRSATIEAFRYIGDFIDYNGNICIPDWAMSLRRNGIIAVENHEGLKFPYKLHIKTPEGIKEANVGDYIVKDTSGITHPCSPDIFEYTYELVDKED